MLTNPIPDRGDNKESFLTGIDFVDASHGWAVAWDGVWFTADGGRTWEEKLKGRYWAVYADNNGVWVAGRTEYLTEELLKGIFHSEDHGESWTLEWDGTAWLSYIGYNE